MWWKKNIETAEIEQWSQKLENETGDEPELEMAAELRKLRLVTPQTSEDYKAALRESLLDQYASRKSETAQRRRLLDIARSWTGWLGVMVLAAIALLTLAVWYRSLQAVNPSDSVDDWLYAPGAPVQSGVMRILIELLDRSSGYVSRLAEWQLATIFGVLFIFGGVFTLVLFMRWLYGLRSRKTPGRMANAYWRSVAAKAMWMSASVAAVLIFVTLAMAGISRKQILVHDVQMQRLSHTVQREALLMRSLNSPKPLSRRSQPSPRLGLAAGGAMDIDNFRENIENGYLPQPTDITYEGLFYDYYFDSGEPLPCDQLFCPTYAQARSHNPRSGEMEEYLAVGLTSGMDESDFKRKRLNLVVVIDISSSMNSTFNRYYYDAPGTRQRTGDGDDVTKTKLQAATESAVAMLDHLAPEDRLGIVLFSDDAVLAKSLRPVGDSDLARLAGHILDLTTAGSTNLASGYRLATNLLSDVARADGNEYENRIVLLTDAQPNTGLIARGGLAGEIASNARRRFYTTVVGVGVDFNSDLIESITKAEGANYYSVHSPAEFVQRLDEGFDYMVTPLVFDLNLELDSPDISIAQVYGSPEADAASGQLMHVKTLFPSDSEDGEVKGGLVLLKLQRNSDAADAASQATLTATYRERSGQQHRNEATITLLPPSEIEHYDHSGIRKGVLLVRYAGLLKEWLTAGHSSQGQTNERRPAVQPQSPLVRAPQSPLGTWERQSSLWQVSPAYRMAFEQFAGHFEREMEAIGDESLQQELDLLEELAR